MGGFSEVFFFEVFYVVVFKKYVLITFSQKIAVFKQNLDGSEETVFTSF